jgi:undecaprenyl-diphosphatase
MDMMLFLKAVVLGLVEGITEFLPISSTGHLILAGDLIGFDGETAKIFEIVIQLGAILAVVWLYREKVFATIRGLSGKREARSFAMNIMIAFFPAAVVGLLTHKFITAYLFNPITVAGALIAGGAAILVIERMHHRAHVKTVEAITVKQSLATGFAQCLALFPGVSRSGATIMGGLLIGFDRRVAVDFSFYLAIPTMFAATLYELVKNLHSLSFADFPLFAVGFVVAFFSALVVIKAFLSYVGRHDFKGFAYYRILFGLFVLAFYWQREWKF